MSFFKEQVGDEWYEFLKEILPNFAPKWKQIVADYKSTKCYPDKDDIFRAFKNVNVDDIRVVIIGQDPYHDGCATGLCFDTNGKKTTPSLRKMYEGFTKEYPHNFYTDLMDGKLHRWCEHGIFMINTALTVQKGKAGSHTVLWEDFTEALFRKINTIDRPILYIAWGKHAQIVVDNLIDNPKHKIIKAKHPASAIYSKGAWDSNGSFQGIEKFIQDNYDRHFEWEPTKRFKK